MDFSELALKVLVLLTPGSVYMKVYRTLQACKAKKDWEDYFEMIFISIISYIIYSLVISTSISPETLKASFEFSEASSLGILSDEPFLINLIEVFFATIIAIIMAFISSYLKKKNLLSKLGKMMRVTDRFGVEDLWFSFNNMEKVEWVTVRDYKAGLDYYGYIKKYSDFDERRELIMENVTIFKDGTEIEYNVDKLYLSREFDDLSIEYYHFKEKELSDGKE